MTRISFTILILTLVILSSCEKKTNESGDTQTKDTLRTDTTVILPDTADNAAASLSEKGAMVAKKWQLTELETPDMKLSGEF